VIPVEEGHSKEKQSSYRVHNELSWGIWSWRRWYHTGERGLGEVGRYGKGGARNVPLGITCLQMMGQMSSSKTEFRGSKRRREPRKEEKDKSSLRAETITGQIVHAFIFPSLIISSLYENIHFCVLKSSGDYGKLYPPVSLPLAN
jgi:hypothetical protein